MTDPASFKEDIDDRRNALEGRGIRDSVVDSTDSEIDVLLSRAMPSALDGLAGNEDEKLDRVGAGFIEKLWVK